MARVFLGTTAALFMAATAVAEEVCVHRTTDCTDTPTCAALQPQPNFCQTAMGVYGTFERNATAYTLRTYFDTACTRPGLSVTAAPEACTQVLVDGSGTIRPVFVRVNPGAPEAPTEEPPVGAPMDPPAEAEPEVAPEAAPPAEISEEETTTEAEAAPAGEDVAAGGLLGGLVRRQAEGEGDELAPGPMDNPTEASPEAETDEATVAGPMDLPTEATAAEAASETEEAPTGTAEEAPTSEVEGGTESPAEGDEEEGEENNQEEGEGEGNRGPMDTLMGDDVTMPDMGMLTDITDVDIPGRRRR